MKLSNFSLCAWLSLMSSAAKVAAEAVSSQQQQQQQQQQNERQLPKHDEVDSRGAGNNDGIQTRIINGDDAERGRYNYFARLYGSSQCGGSLVAPDLALTNAHCS